MSKPKTSVKKDAAKAPEVTIKLSLQEAENLKAICNIATKATGFDDGGNVINACSGMLMKLSLAINEVSPKKEDNDG